MTREDLQNYQAIRRERDQLKRQMAELEAASRYAGTQRLDGMPRASSVGRPTESAAIPQAQLWHYYKAKETQLAQKQYEVETAIDGLAPVERTIFRYHYIEGLKWETVMDLMHYSLRHVMRIHEQALKTLGL